VCVKRLQCYAVREFPSKDWTISIVYKLLQKLWVTGSVECHPSNSRQHSTCTADNIELVYELVVHKNGWATDNICTLYLITGPYSLQKKLSKLIDKRGRYNKCKHRRFRHKVYSITKKEFSGFMFPQVVQRH